MTHDIVKTKVEGFHLNYIALLKKPQKRMSPEKLKQYRQSPSSYIVFHEKPFLKIKRVEAWRDRVWSTEFPSQDKSSKEIMDGVTYDDDDEFNSDASEEEDSEDYCSSNSCSSQEDSSLGPSEVEIKIELEWKSGVDEGTIRGPLIIDFNQILELNDPSSLAHKSSLQVAELENETILIFSPPFKNKWQEIRIGFNERQGFQDFWERLDFGEHYTLSKKRFYAWEEPPSKVFENQEKSGQGSRVNAVSETSQS